MQIRIQGTDRRNGNLVDVDNWQAEVLTHREEVLRLLRNLPSDRSCIKSPVIWSQKRTARSVFFRRAMNAIRD